MGTDYYSLIQIEVGIVKVKVGIAIDFEGDGLGIDFLCIINVGRIWTLGASIAGIIKFGVDPS